MFWTLLPSKNTVLMSLLSRRRAVSLTFHSREKRQLTTFSPNAYNKRNSSQMRNLLWLIYCGVEEVHAPSFFCLNSNKIFKVFPHGLSFKDLKSIKSIKSWHIISLAPSFLNFHFLDLPWPIFLKGMLS